MKTNIVWLLIAMLVGVNGYSQIYPDDPSLSTDFESGKEDRLNFFPCVQKSLDLDGDGVSESITVNTVQVYTVRTPWAGKNSGREAINAVASWLYKKNVVANEDGDVCNYLVVGIEPVISAAKKDDGGNLVGMKISYIELSPRGPAVRVGRPMLNSTFVFLPWLDSKRKPSHTVVSAVEVASLQKKLVIDFLNTNDSPGILWETMKGHFRKDGRVLFGGVWLGLKVPMPVKNIAPRTRGLIERNDSNFRKKIEEGQPRENVMDSFERRF